MHPAETKRAVATGRMAHRCLANSLIIEGAEFNDNQEVNALINDPKVYPVVLYPGAKSRDITHLSVQERRDIFPADREPVLFVIDGTWHQARKMLYRSTNLHQLPGILFTPSRLSGFKVRKQPRDQCFSTIEAIHELLTLLSTEKDRPQDILLTVFEKMVAQQVEFRNSGGTRHEVGRERRKARRDAGKARRRLASSEAR